MRRWLPLSVLAALTSGFLAAAEKDRTLELRFVPQEAIFSARLTLPPELTTRALRLSLEDGRDVADEQVIGGGTGDDKKAFAWRTTSDVEAFALSVLEQVSAGWDVIIDPNAPMVLRVILRHFWTSEHDQAVGSFYVAEVRVAAGLEDEGGNVLASSNGFGDARRYGRKRSADNSNEVLSDALKEAYASLLKDLDLQRAWAGHPKGADAANSIDPATLLSELVKLMEQGFGAELLAQFVKQRSLTRTMSAEDLLAWKQARVPEQVIQAALSRPVIP